MTQPVVPAEAPGKPGVIDRLRNRMPWFDHVVRAEERYTDSKGDFFAAGITFFTVFAMFPLLMLGFATAGFVLASRPELLVEIEERIRETISGELGQQVVQLMDMAIESRTSVGIVGLGTAAWAGLAWMGNLREALSQMWGLSRGKPPRFFTTLLPDFVALLSTFVAIVITIGLTALGNTSLLENVLNLLRLNDLPGLPLALHGVSVVMSLAVSWLLFTWMIARLPRKSAGFRSSIRAGLMAAVGFELFKQVGSIYLRSVVTGPAGATFGPVLGLMVFAYVTARLVLFATAWAATSKENLREEVLEPPPPAVIHNRVITRPGLARSQATAAAILGAIGALSLSRLHRRQRRL
jgi:membrane protein